MSQKGKIIGVSLGPGDPELITLKGYNVLKEVDHIYYPGSRFGNGQEKSYSFGILEKLGIERSKTEGFFLEMNLDRIQAQAIYKQTALKIKEEVLSGKNIAIVCEGDLSTYSSFSYLLAYFAEFDLPVSLIPGITSFANAAAEIQDPLVLLNETMKIIPRVKTEEDLNQALMESDTIVLMKIKSVMDVIFPILEQDNYVFVYAERLGTPDQFLCTEIDQLKERIIPYFSLIIIKNKKA
ncbi:MAG: precorrin-2 C(20)-methyltransferase [Crocinitomicaceae bacterium]|nr:precorrin-2 C(20)-methyltransferase [Crocinitomicaceae bacterium]